LWSPYSAQLHWIVDCTISPEQISRSKFMPFSCINAHSKRGKLMIMRIYKQKVRSFPARFCAFPAPVQPQEGHTQRHSCTMATGNAAPGGRQRELFRFKKPNLNELSIHATGEPVPPTVLQSSIPTVTDNGVVIARAAHSLLLTSHQWAVPA
jgi:hypothetical protein